MVAASSTLGRVHLSRLAAALILPSTVDLVFLTLAFAVPFGFTSRLFASDGDIGRHIRVGADILAQHALFFRDQYSFTMAGQPFVPYEWLSEVIFATANQVGGLAGVAIATGIVVGLTYSGVVVILRSKSVDPFLAILVGLLSAAVGLLHWLARPHLFTPLGAVTTLYLLERGRGRLRWLVTPLFVLWANLHGGFLFGLIMIATYVVGDVIEARAVKGLVGFRAGLEALPRSFWLGRAREHTFMLVGAMVGSCVNPSGPRLFEHLIGFLGDRFLVDHTLEYLSPDFHSPVGQLFLVVLLGSIGSLVLSASRPTFPRLLLFTVDCAFALFSLRNIPLFAVTALPLVVLTVDHAWREWSWTGRPRAIIAEGERDTVAGLWASAGLALLVLLAVNRGQLGPLKVSARFDPSHFPVQAVAAARAAGLGGRIFNEFIWGGYILYAWPEERVFIDGQTDFYGDAVTRRYLQITELDDGWRDALRQEGISTVIVPTSSLLARELSREPGWHTWYRDETAVILVDSG